MHFNLVIALALLLTKAEGTRGGFQHNGTTVDQASKPLTRKQDRVETRGRQKSLELPFHSTQNHKINAHLKRPTEQRDPREDFYLDELPDKVCKFGRWFKNHTFSWTGVARGRRPGPVAPCRTPTTGYTL